MESSQSWERTLEVLKSRQSSEDAIALAEKALKLSKKSK